MQVERQSVVAELVPALKPPALVVVQKLASCGGQGPAAGHDGHARREKGGFERLGDFRGCFDTRGVVQAKRLTPLVLTKLRGKP